jgi:hypothetical protein
VGKGGPPLGQGASPTGGRCEPTGGRCEPHWGTVCTPLGNGLYPTGRRCVPHWGTVCTPLGDGAYPTGVRCVSHWGTVGVPPGYASRQVILQSRLTASILAGISHTLTGIVATLLLVESLLPQRFSAGGEGADRRMRGRWLLPSSELFQERAWETHENTQLQRENRPLIRLRHLLPPQETAGGEGLSIKGVASGS